MKRLQSLAIAFIILSMAHAVELELINGETKLVFDEQGAVVSKVIFQERSLFDGKLPSFDDRIFQEVDGMQLVEELNTVKFRLEGRADDARHTGLVFSAMDGCIKGIRITKTFRLEKKSNILHVNYNFRNIGDEERELGLGNKVILMFDKQVNHFYQPRQEGMATYTFPGQAAKREATICPPQRFLAYHGDDGTGAIMLYPEDKISGFMNWMSGVATMEYTGVLETVKPGEAINCDMQMILSNDIPALLKKADYPTRKNVGRPVVFAEKMADYSKPIQFQIIKNSTSHTGRRFDVTVRRQATDSYRDIELETYNPDEKLAMYPVLNNNIETDRPLDFTIRQAEDGKHHVIFKVPALKRINGFTRFPLMLGTLIADSKGNFYGDTALTCGLVFDAPEHLAKPPEDFPQSTILIDGGDFESKDPDGNFPIPADFVKASRHFRAVWDADGGIENSKCIHMNKGFCAFVIIPELGQQYEFSADVKIPQRGDVSKVTISLMDRDGKRISSKALLYEDIKTDWKHLQATVTPQENCAYIQFNFSTGEKVEGHEMLIDNVQVTTTPYSSKIRPLEEVLGEQLEKIFNIPIGILEHISFRIETPHEKWFKPAEKPSVLFLPNMSGAFNTLDKRLIVELAQRMDMDFTMVPLLRKPISVRGAYAVYPTVFANEVSAYTMTKLNSIQPWPKVVIMNNVDFATLDKNFMELLKEKMKSSHFILVNSKNFPTELRHKRLAMPKEYKLIPHFYAKASDMFEFFNDPSGNTHAFAYLNISNRNSARVIQQNESSYPVYYSREFNAYEYQYLNYAKLIRNFNGMMDNACIVAADYPKITVNAKNAFEGTLTATYRSINNEVDCAVNVPIKIPSGQQSITLDMPPLSGGVHVVDMILMDKEGRAVDAAATNFTTEETCPIELSFSKEDKVFLPREDIVMTVNLPKLPQNSITEIEVEDTDFRIVRKHSAASAASMEYSFQFPQRQTMLYRVFVRVRQNGQVIARRMEEISNHVDIPDVKDVQAYSTSGHPLNSLYLQQIGFKRAISGFGSYTGSTNARINANLNMFTIPRGCGGSDKEVFRLYRDDNPAAPPVRTPCFSDPEYLAKQKATIESIAKAVNYKFYNVRFHWLSDESYLGSNVCYSPFCLAEFRKDLMEQYGTLEALNSEWDTSFKTLDEVMPVQLNEIPSKENLSRWLDHKMFMARHFAENWIRHTNEVLNEVSPDSICGPTGTQPPGYGYDWAQLLKYIGSTGYYSGVQRKLVHDLSRTPNLVAGRCGGGYTHGHVNYEAYNYDTMWVGLLHGSNLAYHYYGASFDSDLSPTMNMEFFAESFRQLSAGPAKLFLSGNIAPQIAMLYSQASVYAGIATLGKDPWQKAQTSWWKVLSDLKIDFKFISYEELAQKGMAQQYKVLILPTSIALSNAERKNIIDFVKRGGTVIADYAPGRFDGHGKRVNDSEFGQLFTQFDGAVSFVTKELHEKALEGEFSISEASLPILENKKFGKGKAINMNLDLSRYSSVLLGGTGGELSTEVTGAGAFQLSIQQLLKAMLAEAGITADITVTDTNGNNLSCVAVMRHDQENRILAIHKEYNSRDKGPLDFEHPQKAHVSFKGKGHVFDVREGKYIGYLDNFDADIVTAWTKMYSILDTKPNPLAISGPAKAARGSQYQLDISTPNAKGPHIYHIEVTSPDGKVVLPLRKNYRFLDGKGSITIETAFNEMRGNWTITATHVNTGNIATHCIVIE